MPAANSNSAIQISWLQLLVAAGIPSLVLAFSLGSAASRLAIMEKIQNKQLEGTDQISQSLRRIEHKTLQNDSELERMRQEFEKMLARTANNEEAIQKLQLGLAQLQQTINNH